MECNSYGMVTTMNQVSWALIRVWHHELFQWRTGFPLAWPNQSGPAFLPFRNSLISEFYQNVQAGLRETGEKFDMKT